MNNEKIKVKICGVTHPADALHAAQCGADFIGINFSKLSRRFVELTTAQEIVQATSEGNAIPVGIFVEESFEEITNCCKTSGISMVQLHGTRAKHSFNLLHGFTVIYQIGVSDCGIQSAPNFPYGIYLLFDVVGGSGQRFDWTNFSPPADTRWFLAGGLTPDNVGEAVKLLKPYAVDVATGVEFSGSTRKDPELVEKFIINTRR